jgi:3-hexulose-6-phosphate synthase/6-phospho-3-hexuloisomerase
LASAGKPYPSPLDQLKEIVAAVCVPVQAVGDLSKTASGDLADKLRLVCERVHAYGDIKVGS